MQASQNEIPTKEGKLRFTYLPGTEFATTSQDAQTLSGLPRLVKSSPRDVQKTVRRHDGNGTTDSNEYQEIVGVFYERYLCRMKPFPEDLLKSFACMGEDPTVYHTMNRPSEFHITGSLRTWSIIPHISSISVPTLLLSGAHDEVQEECVQPFFEGITKGSVKWVVFAESSHMAHLEERERHMRIVRAFLEGV